MTLIVDDQEIDLIYFNGAPLSGLYFNGTEIDYRPTSLMNFNGGITDYGSGGTSWTATGSTAISTDQKHDGTHSLHCDSGVLYGTLALPSTYSIEFWLYVASSALESGTWGAGFSTTNTDGVFIVGDGGARVYIENSLVYADYDYNNVDKWAHWKLVYDGTDTTVYLNGVSKATYAGAMGENANSVLTLGGYTSDAGSSFSSAHKPYIDGFKITSP